MKAIQTFEDIKERCVVDDVTGCWLWTGALKDGKRPRVSNPYQGGQATGVGRLIGCIKAGKAIPSNVVYFCRCAELRCANPEHFTKGDMSSAWKSYRPKLPPLHRARIQSAARKRARFTPEFVREVREFDGTDREAAEKFGIHKRTAWYIRKELAEKPRVVASVFDWRP